MTQPRTLGADIVDLVDLDALRDEVRKKYREVANPFMQTLVAPPGLRTIWPEA